jgi:hypothetical protein
MREAEMSPTAYKRLRRVTVGYCYRGLASDQLRKGLYWAKVAGVIPARPSVSYEFLRKITAVSYECCVESEAI